MKYLLIILLSGCAGTKVRDSTQTKTVIVKHPACCDSLIELNKNDTLILQFTERPGRAFSWLLTPNDKTENIVMINENRLMKSDNDDAEELVEYYFEAKTSGSSELKYKFQRPWEKSKPAADSCTVKVIIR
ncbi:MAG: protease inhibitor I42 family protein [Paludibacter sp.]|nr:protease inhibitor I42 family protein [Paludibacter sp.]